jgi:two-component system response regulator
MGERNNEIVILLVEDNHDHAELTMAVLGELKVKHEVVRVQDGEQALTYLLEGDSINNPTLVLLDLNMPKVGGLEVLRKMRSEDSTRNIPVVIMTSSSEEKDIIDSYNLGANSYIVKPVNYEQFSLAVEQLGLYWLGLNIPP